MTREELESKIKLVEVNIEMTNEIMDFNKKSDRSIIFIAILGFVIMFLANLGNKNLGFISVFSISFFTATVYNMIFRILEETRDNKFKLERLEMELSYYKSLLERDEFLKGEEQCD